MKLQYLPPLHTYGEGNDDRIAVHAATFASHLNADVHALVLAVEFPKVSSPIGSMIIDVPAMAAEAKASCRTWEELCSKLLRRRWSLRELRFEQVRRSVFRSCSGTSSLTIRAIMI